MATKFSARHYVVVAQVLYACKPSMDTTHVAVSAYASWERTCLAFLKRFRRDNPKFDADKFLKTCKGD